VPGASANYSKPYSLDRSIDVLGFSFVDGLGRGGLRQGNQSPRLVVQTNASEFGPTNAAILNGSVANVRSFAPSTTLSAVPDPPAWVLAASGVVAAETIVLIRRSRRRMLS
jgi:hypothetical protein